MQEGVLLHRSLDGYTPSEVLRDPPAEGGQAQTLCSTRLQAQAPTPTDHQGNNGHARSTLNDVTNRTHSPASSKRTPAGQSPEDSLRHRRKVRRAPDTDTPLQPRVVKFGMRGSLDVRTPCAEISNMQIKETKPPSAMREWILDHSLPESLEPLLIGAGIVFPEQLRVIKSMAQIKHMFQGISVEATHQLWITLQTTSCKTINGLHRNNQPIQEFLASHGLDLLTRDLNKEGFNTTNDLHELKAAAIASSGSLSYIRTCIPSLSGRDANSLWAIMCKSWMLPPPPSDVWDAPTWSVESSPTEEPAPCAAGHGAHVDLTSSVESSPIEEPAQQPCGGTLTI